MRFFTFQSTLSADEIKERCEPYLACEMHSPWGIFDEYTSGRIGVHLTYTKKGFRCYFENGERNRTHSLQSAKTWASVRITQKDGKITARGFTFFCPPLAIVLLLFLLGILFTRDFLAIVLMFLICSFVFISTQKDEKDIIYRLQKILQS